MEFGENKAITSVIIVVWVTKGGSVIQEWARVNLGTVVDPFSMV